MNVPFPRFVRAVCYAMLSAILRTASAASSASDSVLNQPFTDWECLIGVETSKDKTEEIVREYEAKDARFKVFTGPRSVRSFSSLQRPAARTTYVFSCS